MARTLSYKELDDLDRMLSRTPSGRVIESKEDQIKPEDMLDSSEKSSKAQSYEMDPVIITPEALKNYKEKEKPTSFDIRSKYNALENEVMFPEIQAQYERRSGADESKKSAYDTSAKMLAMLARKAASGSQELDLPESSFDANAYQKSLKEQLDNLAKSPQDIPESQKILNAALPVLLSAGFGPQGAEAGVASFNVGQQDIADTRKRMENERLAKIQGIGKQIEGAGKLLSAENERRKQALEEQKYGLAREDKAVEMLANYQKWLVDHKIKDSSEAQKEFMDIQKQKDLMLQKGVTELSDIQQSQDKMDWQGSENELNRKAAEKRARIGAQAAAQRLREKPSTQGQAKAAMAYSSTTKAEEAYERMKKDLGYIPSTGSRFFDFQKSLFENPNKNIFVADLLKMVPDADIRRQVQAELDFLAPVLREESGAAISVSEWLSYANRYFPRRNDDEKTIAEKDASRLQTRMNYKTSAGSAPLPQIIQPVNVDKQKAEDRESKIKLLKKLQGK